MPTAMPNRTTDRLLIRPLTLDDLEACHQLLDVAAWQTGQPLEARRAWLEWSVMNYAALANLYQPPYGDRAVALKATGELAGLVGLVPALGPFDRLPSYGGDLEPNTTGQNSGCFGRYVPSTRTRVTPRRRPTR